jgi:hypothetical protein
MSLLASHGLDSFLIRDRDRDRNCDRDRDLNVYLTGRDTYTIPCSRRETEFLMTG